MLKNKIFTLPLSLKAWNSDSFETVLKQEVCSLDADSLPLHQGLQHSSYAISDSLSITVLNVVEDNENIFIKAGLFYTGVIAGCNCADDPSPVDEINEYCNVQFSIDKQTAKTSVVLVD